MANGDDFEDDYVPDDLVAELEAAEDAAEVSDDEEFAGFAEADSLSQETPGAGPSKIDDEAKMIKKRKRREKEKLKRTKKRRLQEASQMLEPESAAVQSPTVLADYLARYQMKTYPKLSVVELEDIRIPEDVIADTRIWPAPRDLDHLCDFIAKSLPTLKTRLAQKPKENGAPTLLFIAGGALRVADVTRVLKSKTMRGEKGGDIAKLFARHFKLEDHVTYLKRTKIGAAVGTPGRIGKLLCETDALSLNALTHIILDVTFQDIKKRSMLDIPETRDEVFKMVLGAETVREIIRRGRVQIVLF